MLKTQLAHDGSKGIDRPIICHIKTTHRSVLPVPSTYIFYVCGTGTCWYIFFRIWYRNHHQFFLDPPYHSVISKSNLSRNFEPPVFLAIKIQSSKSGFRSRSRGIWLEPEPSLWPGSSSTLNTCLIIHANYMELDLI